MLEIKDNTTAPPSQIEFDSLLPQQLQAKKYKLVYQLDPRIFFAFHISSRVLKMKLFYLP